MTVPSIGGGLNISGLMGAPQSTPALDQMSSADQKKFLENLLASLQKKSKPTDASSPSQSGSGSPSSIGGSSADDNSADETPLEQTIRKLLGKLKHGGKITSKDSADLAALMKGNQTDQGQTSGGPSTTSTGVITPLTVH